MRDAEKRRQTIAILSDQTLFRDGLEELLRGHGFAQVAGFSSSAALLHAAHARAPELVLVDLDHEREDVSTLMHSLRRALQSTHIVVIGSALRQGVADGLVDGELETPAADAAALFAATQVTPRFRRSAEAIRQRKLWAEVTPRKRDVLRWLATGADNRTIARRLHIGQRAVKAHISSLLLTFDLHNRAQLSLLAERGGLKPAPSL